MVKIGDPVTYVDPQREPRPALVTAIHPGMNPGQNAEPGVNLVFVSDDKERRDGYGRQIERATSVVHKTAQPAHGNYWE